MLKKILVFIFTAANLLANAQNQSLSGKVSDSVTGIPLANAHVMVPGTTIGTATDTDGRFTFSNLSSDNKTLRISYSGYSTIVKVLSPKENQPIEILMKPTIFDINQVVVTGTRSPKTIKETPVLTQVISANTLESSDLPTIETALEHSVPSIEFSYGTYGASIQMMGLTGNYMVFLQDGNKIAGETNGNIDFNRLSTQGANRIEIVRGASSVLYGSNAMAGVINILSKPQVQPLKLDVTTRYSNFNTSLVDANIGIKNNNLLSQSTYRFSHTDGYDLNNSASDGKTVERTTSNQFTQKFIWTPLTSLELEAKGTVFANHMDQTLPMRNDKAHADLDYAFRAKYYIASKGYVEGTWHEDRYKTYEKDGFNRSLQYDNSYRNGRIIGNYALTNWNTITAGAEQIEETMISPRNAILEKTNTDRVFYVQDDVKITKWVSLIGGLRYNQNSEFEDHTTWQLSAMTNINWLTLRGNFATGFKTPTLKERYMDFRVPIGFPISIKGNPNLVPEESKYLSVSAEVNLKKLNFSINVFQNKIDKMIAEVLLPFNPAEPGNNYEYQNINEVKVVGVDVLFQFQPIHALRVNGGYSFYSALDRELDRQLIGSRNHSGRLNMNYSFEHKFKPTISLQGSYYGEIYRTIINENSGDETNAWLEDFSLWKLIVSAKPISGVAISSGIDNIMDYTDKKTFATFSPGRTFFVGVRVSL